MHERLKAERLKSGLSQQEFGLIGGVSRSAQINYEKGERVPDAVYFAKINKKLNCDINYIILGEYATGLPKEETDLIEKYRAVNQHLKRAVNAVLDSDITKEK